MSENKVALIKTEFVGLKVTLNILEESVTINAEYGGRTGKHTENFQGARYEEALKATIRMCFHIASHELNIPGRVEKQIADLLADAGAFSYFSVRNADIIERLEKYRH